MTWYSDAKGSINEDEMKTALQLAFIQAASDSKIDEVRHLYRLVNLQSLLG